MCNSLQRLKQDKSYLIYTWIIGLICHGYLFFNDKPVYSSLSWALSDAVNHLYDGGRWMAIIVNRVSGQAVLPWVMCVECTLLITLMTWLIVDLFAIRVTSIKLLISVLIASSPVIYSMFAFVYMADVLTVSLFLSALAVHCLYMLPKRYERALFFVLFLVMSYGCYQASIAMAVLLIIIKELVNLLTGEKIHVIVRNSVTYAILTAVSIVAGSIIGKIVCHLYNIEMMYEAGIPTSIRGIWYLVKHIYSNFYTYIGYETIYSKPVMLFVLLLSVVLTLYFVIVIAHDSVQEKKDFVIVISLSLCVLFVMPTIIEGIHGLSYRDYMAYRMWGGWLPFTLMTCILFSTYVEKKSFIPHVDKQCDKSDIKVNQLSKCAGAVTIFITIIMAWNQYIAGNTMYKMMEYAYEKDYSTAIRIVSYIETDDNYKPGADVYVIGEYRNRDDRSIHNVMNDNSKNMDGAIQGIWGTGRGLNNFVHEYISTDINFYSYEDNIVSAEEMSNMRIFPENGCLKYINGAYILKIGD